MNSFKSLINLSKDQRIASNLYDHIEMIVSIILDGNSPFRDFATMLLANLTKFDGCHLKVCEFLPKLFPAFIQGGSGTITLDMLGSVFADLTNTKEGRELFLADKYANFFRISTQLQSSRVMRRGGSVSTLKNCLFETSHHEAILECDDEEDRFLANMVGLLASPKSVFDDEELEEMVLDIQLEYRHSEAEPDATIRCMVMESLIILGHSLYGREKMRSKKIYPILREWHKQEPEETLKELLEKVVELIIRDESGEETGDA